MVSLWFRTEIHHSPMVFVQFVVFFRTWCRKVAWMGRRQSNLGPRRGENHGMIQWLREFWSERMIGWLEKMIPITISIMIPKMDDWRKWLRTITSSGFQRCVCSIALLMIVSIRTFTSNLCNECLISYFSYTMSSTSLRLPVFVLQLILSSTWLQSARDLLLSLALSGWPCDSQTYEEREVHRAETIEEVEE